MIFLQQGTIGQDHSKSDGALKKSKLDREESSTQLGDRDRTSDVHPVGGSKALKRNTRLTKSFHGRGDRQKHHHGSNLSLQEAGLRIPSGSFSRTYSFRAASGSASSRYSIHKKDRSRLHSNFTKATAANFDGPLIELSVPRTLISENAEEGEEPAPSEKISKGGLFHRTLSIRSSHSRSRSRSPNPTPTSSDSVFTGMHMYTVDEELSQRGKSKLSTLSKHHLQTLDLATSDFEACLSIDSSRRLCTTFTPPSSIFGRSITPILPLVNTPPTLSELLGSHHLAPSHHLRREPPPPPKLSTKLSSHSSSDAREYYNKLPKFKRSATISAGNPVIKKTAESLRKMYISGNGRPASVALVEDQFVELSAPFNANTVSQSSLDSHSDANSQSQSILSLYGQPHKQTSLSSLEQSPTCATQPQIPTTQVCTLIVPRTSYTQAGRLALLTPLLHSILIVVQ